MVLSRFSAVTDKKSFVYCQGNLIARSKNSFKIMKVILSSQCLSLTGMLERGLGYSLQRRKSGFYSQRSKHGAPPDGHWRFIVLCAELAKNGLHISDIQVSREELHNALYEAHHFVAAEHVNRWIKLTYNARDIINLKITFGL